MSSSNPGLSSPALPPSLLKPMRALTQRLINYFLSTSALLFPFLDLPWVSYVSLHHVSMISGQHSWDCIQYIKHPGDLPVSMELSKCMQGSPQ